MGAEERGMSEQLAGEAYSADEADAFGSAGTSEGYDSADSADSADGAGAPVDDLFHLWDGDTGSLPFDARSALLRLVRGPYISETADGALWRAFLNYADTIRSRLADLFLELCVDAEAGVAFAKNVSAEGREFPKAASSYTMTLLDTIMVLLFRKELQSAGNARVFIGQAELFEQMGQYRPLDKMDQAAFLKRLETSWRRLVEQRMLVKTDVEGRFEISPVLKLVFGAEEVQAVLAEYANMLESSSAGAVADEKGDEGEGGTLFDGLV